MYPAELFRDTLSRLLGILTHHEVRFHLTGGITSVAYGEPRMTQDIDIVVDNSAIARTLDGFMAAATQAGFMFDAEIVRSAVADRSMFQLFDMAEALKIDIYPREMIPGELDRSALLEVFEGMQIPVASRPDAAASKLAWASKGSHKSRRDLRQIVRQMPAAQRVELDRLAGLLGLGDLLAEILAEPDEIAG
ncbi:MAG: nucleotidyl transferase AbiEii/AbiGii toxin family protein [Planctomycetaceae bacterium]